MSDDTAQARAAARWPGARNGWARRLPSGRCCVGSGDDEFRYLLGQGSTWEAAFADADETERLTNYHAAPATEESEER